MTKTRVRGKINRIVAFALAAIVGLSSPLSAMATEAVKTSNYVISKVDAARNELEKLSNSRSINGAIYLKDAYTVKSEANQYSEDVITIASGQSVSIISVDVDEGRNIWYKIQYTYSDTTVTGYVEREFIVSSDSRFLSWEDRYITTTNREAIRDTSDCSDIEAFPESYRDALYELRKTHPNWRFVKQDVNLDWNTVIAQETSGERSLIGASADSSYKEKLSANTANWYVATKGIVAYYIDPRNFLAEDTIFMFEQETYNADVHTSSAVSKVLNGTFMSGGIPDTTVSYADTFVGIGSRLNMSPIALASRVKQEQGVQGTSALISGTYAGFEGYYNYFNVKANGATKALVIQNGLTYAKQQGWNTRVKSLEGGASLIAKQYVNRGQDTLYLQKFDVDNSDGTLYSHQYMQNIQAPYSEAISTYKAYKKMGLTDNTFVFKIPVYDNMPKGRCNKPNAQDVVSLNVSKVENLPVDQNAVLVSLINGGQNTDVPMTFESSNSKIATVNESGVVTGISPGTVTISAKRTENTTNTASCQVSVIKADIAISKVAVPDISITYDENSTLGATELPVAFAWVDDSIVPTVENEGYSVVYSPDNSRYNSLTMTIPVKVAKATVDADSLSLPKELSIDAGCELSTVALPSGYAWKDETITAPKKTGNSSFEAIYCIDTANYEPLTVEISLKVVCKSHEYGDWEGTHADCENDGELVRYCNICGAPETLAESASGHNYISEVTKEPTTKEVGERTYTCTKCGDTYIEDIPKLVDTHTHSYAESITTEAGCLTTGVKTFTCKCGDTYTETIEMLGHSYENNVCTRCGYELPVVPVHIHDYTLANDTATCTEDGVRTYKCGCGESYTEASTKAGHSIENGECTKCDYVEPAPTVMPTAEPTKKVEPTPTAVPTKKAEPTPTAEPTKKVEPTPTAEPTKKAEPTPTAVPTVEPTKKVEPTSTAEPTKKVEPTPTVEPTKKAELAPTAEPTKKAEPTPTAVPTAQPTAEPTKKAEPTPTTVGANSSDSNNTKTDSSTTNAEIVTPTDAVTPTETVVPAGSSDNKVSTGNKTSNQKPVEPQIEKVDEFAQGEKPVSVVMMSTTVLNSDKIEEYISGDNKRLEITMANDVVWNIDLTDIDDYSQIDMNLAVSFDDAQIPQDTVDNVAGDKEYRLVDLKYDGQFPCPVTLKIPVDPKYIGMIANLFYFNPETGELEYANECAITEECTASYIMKHASAYVMIYNDVSMDPGIIAAIDSMAEKVVEEQREDFFGPADPDEPVEFTPVNITLIVSVSVAVLILVGILVGILIRNRRDDEFDDYDDEDE